MSSSAGHFLLYFYFFFLFFSPFFSWSANLFGVFCAPVGRHLCAFITRMTKGDRFSVSMLPAAASCWAQRSRDALQWKFPRATSVRLKISFRWAFILERLQAVGKLERNVNRAIRGDEEDRSVGWQPAQRTRPLELRCEIEPRLQPKSSPAEHNFSYLHLNRLFATLFYLWEVGFFFLFRFVFQRHFMSSQVDVLSHLIRIS